MTAPPRRRPAVDVFGKRGAQPVGRQHGIRNTVAVPEIEAGPAFESLLPQVGVTDRLGVGAVGREGEILAKALIAAYNGVSPQTSREVATRALGSSNASITPIAPKAKR